MRQSWLLPLADVQNPPMLRLVQWSKFGYCVAILRLSMHCLMVVTRPYVVIARYVVACATSQFSKPLIEYMTRTHADDIHGWRRRKLAVDARTLTLASA